MTRRLLSGGLRRRHLYLPAGILGVWGFSTGFDLEAIFSFLEPGALRFAPLVPFAAGVLLSLLAVENPSPKTRKRWLQRGTLLGVTAYLGLWGLHLLWVESFPDQGAFVLSWSRNDCECAHFEDEVCKEARISDVLCITCLSFDEEAVERCWGRGRVRTVKVLLALFYFFFAGGGGFIVGLRTRPDPPFRVFVSYRRKDSDEFVNEVLAGALQEELGDDNVFVDKRSIRGGEDWARQIRRHCNTCQAAIVVIGPVWRDELEARLGTKDWVRYEIEKAIRKKVELLPIVIGGAAMPSASDLPRGMAPLARIQAVEVAEDSLEEVMDALDDLRDPWS